MKYGHWELIGNLRDVVDYVELRPSVVRANRDGPRQPPTEPTGMFVQNVLCAFLLMALTLFCSFRLPAPVFGLAFGHT